MPRSLQRLLLAALFVVFAALQVRITIASVTLAADPQSVPNPPFQIDPGTLAFISVEPVLEHAGAKAGDVLVAEDGQRLRSFLDFDRLFFRHKPGEKLTLTLRRGTAPPFNATFIVPARSKDWLDALIVVFLNIVTPWFCILLGFLAAFRRTGDPIAYALLALLLCVSQLLKANLEQQYAWGPLFTWPMLFLNEFSHRALPVAWLWFAVLFPDPKSRYKLLPWTRWALGVPYLIESFLLTLASTAYLHRAGALTWLFDILKIPAWSETLIEFVLLLLGFANFVYKLAREHQCTVRRKLRWVLFGLALGVLPSIALFAGAALLHKDPNRLSPFILAPVIFSPFFVPLTLAYAVLVDRLFDVGVFVRQGLLASKTVTVVRYALAGGFVYLAIRIEERKDLGLAQRLSATALCVAAVIGIRWASEWLRRWVDRHFFQEAVNTEHLLIELSAEVRRIANPELLLRTVTERIANALHVSRVVAFVPNAGGFVPAYETGAGSFAPGELNARDPIVARLRGQRQPVARSDELLLPIGAGEDLLGILSLGPKRSEQPYSGQDIRLLESVAGQTALALENSRLAATVAEEAIQRERITGELEIARKVQERLFPRAAPQVPGLELSGRCLPAQTVGGDYYDFLVLPSGGVGLAIGDVAGKGVPAALLMAGLQASLRGLALAGISHPADLMTKLNILVYDATPVNRFATFFYGLYDPLTRKLQYSSAGHNPALLYRPASDETIWLKTPGVGLGLKRGSTYAQAEVQLDSGDCLVLYTDGITEARNHAEEEFGEDRLMCAVRRYASSSADRILNGVVEETACFTAGAPQFDDLTLVVAHVSAS